MTLPSPLARRLVLTSTLMWVAVRVALGALGVLRVSAPGTLMVAGIVLATVWLDLRRNVEVLLYANLAVSPLLISLLVTAVALTLEVAASVPVSMLAPPVGEASLP